VLQRVSDVALAVARVEWAEGDRRLAQLDLPRAQLETVRRVVDELVWELTRRLGQTFTMAELSDVYGESAAWCLEIVQRTTDLLIAQDLSLVQQAAFARFARGAVDYRP
jgi:hypothetical protein